MVTQRPDRRQAVRLTWTLAVDVEHWNALRDVEALAHVGPGQTVTVNVGRTSPWDAEIDSRIPKLLVHHARARDLHLELTGTLDSIAEWWRAIRGAEDPIRAARHLRAVPRASRREMHG